MEIKYICFDIENVANENAFKDMLSKGQERWGCGFSESDLKRIVFPSFKEDKRDYWREFQNGILKAEDYLTIAMRAGGFEESEANKNHLRECLLVWCGKPYQKITDLVMDLKKNGYHTSVLSNNNEIMYHSGLIEISNYADVSISSHEIGVSKPCPQAYSKLLERIGAENPNQVVFIDDKLRNIVGARKLGINGFHFRSEEIGMDSAFEELITYLRKKKIKSNTWRT